METVQKILVITLSNFGDVVLTLPVLDHLRQRFPGARLTVMVGPRPKEIFAQNPFIDNLIIYDKYSSWSVKLALFFALKKERFDIVIDLRNTLYGALLPARYKTSPFLVMPRELIRAKDRHLYRLQRALKQPGPLVLPQPGMLFTGDEDKALVQGLLKQHYIIPGDKIVLISPETGGANRKWPLEKIAGLCRVLSNEYVVVIIGSKKQALGFPGGPSPAKGKIVDLSGSTTLSQLVYLITQASLMITADTGTLQLASYLNKPIVALFGASDDIKYGPWSEKYRVVKKEVTCRPCQKAQCLYGTVECMELIKVQDVVRAVREVLSGAPAQRREIPGRKEFKRILVVRTDKIGDVVLSTPVIEALRNGFPSAYLAMMVAPHAKDIIDGNPYLDKVIVYDKDNLQKSWRGTILFARQLSKLRFDLVVVLHPSNRAHLVAYLSGIPKRLGYNRKMGFLLTDRLEHTKQSGQKHEMEYNLDLVRYLGVVPRHSGLYVPLTPEAEVWVSKLFVQNGVKENAGLIAIHPAASCISKFWMPERFAQVADRLIDKYNVVVLIVAGAKDAAIAEAVMKKMRHKALNLAGKTSVAQLAVVLQRCRLFISNDSGPVHVAAALKTPVVVIYGRNQPGLGPKRWGPLGPKDQVLHKEAGCFECLAHYCKKGFACLKAITVEEVIAAAEKVLGG
ncbi:MAG: lipopolysaccharide heptosyltransferase II [Candidatus Omnitrophota bacterium]